MSSDYSYDEEGQFYPFFIFTVSAIIALPLTYSVARPNRDPDALAPAVDSNFQPAHHDLIQAQRRAQRRKQRKIKRGIAMMFLWSLAAFMLYLIHTTQPVVNKIWNPYDILGISDSSTEKQIKSHYKRLSLKFHPDKIRPDPAKNETVESLSDKYVEISKAYQALTDDEVRNNYIQYGHPDGKQSYSIGIALPKFIVTDGNGKYVVLLYALLVGVLLPYLVGKWWYGTQRMSKEGVLMESANRLFREYADDLDDGSVIAALSTGKEFEDVLRGVRAKSNIIDIEFKLLSRGTGNLSAKNDMSMKERERLQSLGPSLRRKVLALLWSHLYRVELENKDLNRAKYAVAPIARSLTNSFLATMLAYNKPAPVLAVYHASQRLVQAVPPKASQLLQLPYFTAKTIDAVDGDSRTPKTLQQFMEIPAAQRRALITGKGGLSEQEYDEAMKVASQFPLLRVEKAFFKVVGEKVIPPQSLVTLVVKGRFIPPGCENVPPATEKDFEDNDAAEDDLKAQKEEQNKPNYPSQTFAPYYGRTQSPKWHIFLTDSKQNMMAVPPFHFASFVKPITKPDGKPTFNMQDLKLSFVAPPSPGDYTFVMHVICDSYVGLDTKMEVTLHIDDVSKAAAVTAEDEISDPDEDTLAGQMEAMKGGKVKKRKSDEDDDDEDDDDEEDESGTDEDDDTSATNTDTEDES